MAWCMSQHCQKQGLSKNDVEFDEDLRMVLCHGCYCLRHPGWVPPVTPTDAPTYVPSVVVPTNGPSVEYEVHFTSERGFEAVVGYQDMSVTFHAPMGTLRKYFYE